MSRTVNNATDGCEDRSGSERIELAAPLLFSPDGSDLRFIGAVLEDLILFAQLNQLEDLAVDLDAARTKFIRQAGCVDEMQQSPR